MSDSDSFPYRVKFKDIRVKPPAEEASRARAKRTRVCEHEGCELEGAYPAPGQNGRGRLYFCERHVTEYNRAFNFFEGMSEAEAAAFVRAEQFGHKHTWKFGTGPMGRQRVAAAHDPRRWAGRGMFDLNESPAESPRGAAHRTGLQLRALQELDLEPDARPEAIRARYAEYVRRFHPDANDGDRSSEHKLDRVLRAGRLLKASGLMRAAGEPKGRKSNGT